MSKHAPGNHNNYSHFDSMSTKDLEEILRLDSQLSDNEISDVDAIIYITEVIEKREKENPTGRFTDVHIAWTSFKENYLPYAEENKSLYISKGFSLVRLLHNVFFNRFINRCLLHI